MGCMVYLLLSYICSPSRISSANSCSGKIIYYTPSCNPKQENYQAFLLIIPSIFCQKCSDLCTHYFPRYILITSGTQGWEKQPPFFPSQSLHFNGQFMGLVSVEGVWKAQLWVCTKKTQ